VSFAFRSSVKALGDLQLPSMSKRWSRPKSSDSFPHNWEGLKESV
jgi:hypothetical protein